MNEISALAIQARDGNEQAFEQLLEKLEPDIYHGSKKFNIRGYTWEDLKQIASITVWEILPTFNPDKAEFRTFATLAIYRKLSTLLKQELGPKYAINNNAEEFIEIIHDMPEPLDPVEQAENFRTTRKQLGRNLTKFENTILDAFVKYNGEYKDMIEVLPETLQNKTKQEKDKAIDNALQRIRRKLQPPGQHAPGKYQIYR